MGALGDNRLLLAQRGLLVHYLAAALGIMRVPMLLRSVSMQRKLPSAAFRYV